MAIDTVSAGTETTAAAAQVIKLLTAIRHVQGLSVRSLILSLMHRTGWGLNVFERASEGGAHPECEQQAVEAKMFGALHRVCFPPLVFEG